MDNQLEKEILHYVTPEYQQLFYNAIEKAITKYEKLSADNTETEFKKRTQANIINDFICEYIKNETEKYPADKLHAYEQHSALRLSISNGRIVARFKKMNSAGSTSNITTQQVLNFENQTNLFNDRPIININVGYFYNGLDCQLMLSHPNGTGIIDWTFPLEPSVPDNITIIPTTQIPTRVPTVRKGLGKDNVQKR